MVIKDQIVGSNAIKFVMLKIAEHANLEDQINVFLAIKDIN
jgi:hypothetical protein